MDKYNSRRNVIFRFGNRTYSCEIDIFFDQSVAYCCEIDISMPKNRIQAQCRRALADYRAGGMSQLKQIKLAKKYSGWSERNNEVPICF